MLLASVNRTPVSITGDGNCLPYAVLRSAGRTVSWEGAIALREAAIEHALSLRPEIQENLRLRRTMEDANDPMGNNLDHRQRRNFWPIAAQAKYGQPYFGPNQAAWMNDNMLHSIATCVGMDVVLIKRTDQGQVHKYIAIYRAEPLNGLPPYSANSDGWTARPGTNVKSVPELNTDARNGGRRICVISIDESKTHFEATKDLGGPS
jgi:hypothetical protein